MKNMTAKVAKGLRKGREGRPAEMFHADARYVADVTWVERPLRLLIANDPVEGWLCAVYYPDTEESITLAQYPDAESARAHIESWARVVHNVKDAIEWVPGKPRPRREEGAAGN